MAAFSTGGKCSQAGRMLPRLLVSLRLALEKNTDFMASLKQA
jgi:hypothetical protein